jgi:hypothetical protein
MILLRLISQWLPRPSFRLVLEPHERSALRVQGLEDRDGVFGAFRDLGSIGLRERRGPG